MSFYFTLNTAEELDLLKVLDKLNDPQVTYQNDEPGIVVFFKPGASLRGAIVYVQPDHYLIGVNAFTTRYDAELTRDVTAAVASVLNCPVHPESQEHSIPADDVAAFCDDAWLDARFQEATFVMGDGSPDTAHEPTTLFGYCRPFAVTPALIDGHKSKGMDLNAAINAVMQDAMALQEYDQTEDVFIPQVMEIAPQNSAPKGFLKGLFSKTDAPAEPTLAFVLTEGVRTLTPIIGAMGPVVAILGSETLPHRKVPIALVEKAARQASAREFCVGAFDLELSGDAYQALYMQGTPM